MVLNSASKTLLPLRGSPSIHGLKRGVVSLNAILRQQPHSFIFADYIGVIAWWIEKGRHPNRMPAPVDWTRRA